MQVLRAATTTMSRIQRPAAIAARTLAAAAQIEERSRHSRSPSSSLSPPPPTPPAERLEEAAYEQEAEKEASPIPTTLKPKRQRKKATPAAKTEEGVDGEATPAPKKKRTRKGKEPPVYVIPPMEQIETDFKSVFFFLRRRKSVLSLRRQRTDPRNLPYRIPLQRSSRLRLSQHDATNSETACILLSNLSNRYD